MSQVQSVVYTTPIISQNIVVSSPPLVSTSTTATFWGPADRAYVVAGAKYVISAQSTSGTLNCYKDSGTQAPGGGTSLLVGGTAVALDSSLVINTVTTASLNANSAGLTLAAGDRLSYTIAGTATSLAGAVIAITLQPLV